MPLLIAMEKILGAKRKEHFLSHVLELKDTSMKRCGLAFQHKDLFQGRALKYMYMIQLPRDGS